MDKKILFLTIDTTTDIFSVAVGGSSGIKAARTLEGKKHSEKLIPEIDALLKKNKIMPEELSALGVGTGPGSFTGIRVGMSFAITSAQVLKIPVYGIPALDMAGKKYRVPVIKAYRDKYYAAEYGNDGKRISDYKLIGEAEKKLLGGALLEGIKAEEMIGEVARLYSQGEPGRWRDLNPIYIMDTVYVKKKSSG